MMCQFIKVKILGNAGGRLHQERISFSAVKTKDVKYIFCSARGRYR